MADDTAALVVALSAQVSKFQKDMNDAVKIADTSTKAIETRFSQMNSKIEQEFSGFVNRYASAAGPLGNVLQALGPVGVTIAAGLGVAATALAFLSQKTDEYIAKQRALQEASQVTGLNIGQLEAVKRAAKESGIEFDKAEAAITRMAVAIDTLREKGSGPLLDTLNKIDPRLADQVINAKDMAEAIDILSKVLDNVSGDFQKAGLAAELFGKRGIENLRLLKETLKQGGLSAAPDITDEDKAFREKLIALDKQVKATQKSVDDTLGKMFSEQIRQNQLTFWNDTAEGLKQAQAAAAWFSGFLQQVKDYVSQQPGVQSTNAELANLKMPQVGAGGPQPRSQTGTSGAPSSLIVDPYAITAPRFDVGPQMKSLNSTVDEAIKGTNQSLSEQAAALTKNLNFLEKWSGVLGDAATPQEQYEQRQRAINKALTEYAPGSEEAILLQEAGTRSLQKLTEAQDAAETAQREQLGVAAQSEILYQKLVVIQKAVELGTISGTEAEVARAKAVQDTQKAYENMIVAASRTPELQRFAFDAANTFKQFDQIATTTLSNFENTLADVAVGSTSLADAFKKMTDSIIRDIIRMTLRMTVTGPIAGALAGLGGGNFGLGSLFMGGGSPSGFGRAAGGPVSAGSPYIVGEHGPELFVPKQSGNIVPNSYTRGGSAGTTSVEINNYTSADSETKQRRQSDGVGGERIIVDIVKKAQARGDFDDVNRARFGLRPNKVR